MASKTYTQRLGAINGLGIGVNDIYDVPPGFLVVVRNITVQLPGTPQLNLGGFDVMAAAEWTFFSRHHPYAETNVAYEWEGRQVIVEGNSLSILTADPGWCVIATGYVFSS